MDGGFKEKSTENGLYRATKLWNNVVGQFKRNMSTGRHRRNMRMYEDCFVASDAVDWLHDYLLKNQDFGEKVTRYQTVQLLQKFDKARVFEGVRNVKHNHIDPFQDDGQLYKFISAVSPKKRTPLKNTANTDSSSCKSSDTPRKQREALMLATVELEKVKPSLPPCQLVEKSLTKEQIEKVWKTVALARLQKLLSNVSIHDLLDAHDIQPSHIIHNATFVSRNGMVTNICKDEHLPQWIISAMRCLAHWPDAVEESLPSYPGFEKDVFRVVKDHFQNSDEPLITFELYDLFYNVFFHSDHDHPGPWRSTPRHPIGMSSDSFLSMENLMTCMASPRPLSNLNISYIANIDVHSNFNQSSFRSLQSFNKSEPSIHETMYITARDESYYDNSAFESSDRCHGSLRRFYSSNNVNDAEKYLRNGQDNMNMACRGSPAQAPPRYRHPPPYSKLLQRTLSSNSNRGNRSSSRTNSYNESLNVIRRAKSVSVERMIELLQVCCLFLPPANRRKLHLLLRLMHKMTHNDRLSLGTGMSMRSKVLETFYRSILLCIDESCYEDQVGLQLAAFMMDHHEKIMVVPARLKQSVETRLADMQRIQIRYGPVSPNEITFCQRVSVQQYEQQKLTNSEEALVDLLDSIMTNEKMTDKEKRRRLKQFQKVYPDIYQKRFPSEIPEVKNKKPLLQGMTGALTRLKAMRF